MLTLKVTSLSQLDRSGLSWRKRPITSLTMKLNIMETFLTSQCTWCVRLVLLYFNVSVECHNAELKETWKWFFIPHVSHLKQGLSSEDTEVIVFCICGRCEGFLNLLQTFWWNLHMEIVCQDINLWLYQLLFWNFTLFLLNMALCMCLLFICLILSGWYKIIRYI